MEKILLYLAVLGYGVASALYLSYALTRRESLAAPAKYLFWMGVLCQAASLVLRTWLVRHWPDHAQYVPWTTWYESLSFFSLVIALQFLLIQRHDMPLLGTLVIPLAGLLLAVGLFSSRGMAALDVLPPLPTGWAALHIPLMFFSYAAFANAFAIGLAFLIQDRQLKSKKPTDLVFRLPPLETLDRLVFRVLIVGFIALTFGLVLGASWAHQAWGRSWQKDPKVIWAFITWLVYLGCLVARHGLGWHGRKTVYLSMAGFALVIFTYVVVSYFSQVHGFLSGGAPVL